MVQNKNSFKQMPNEKGYFGIFGGRYVSETLMPLIKEVEKEYNNIKNDKFMEVCDKSKHQLGLQNFVESNRLSTPEIASLVGQARMPRVQKCLLQVPTHVPPRHLAGQRNST